MDLILFTKQRAQTVLAVKPSAVGVNPRFLASP